MLDEKKLKKLTQEIEAGGKLAEEHPRLDLRTQELYHIAEKLQIPGPGTFEALTSAFVLGLARGYKLGKRSTPAPRRDPAALAYAEMVSQAAGTCQDAELLDLVYKLLTQEA